MRDSLRYLAIIALMLGAWWYMSDHHDRATVLGAPLKDFPAQVGDWRVIRHSEFDKPTLDVLRPTEYLAVRYQRADGALADLYVGYHDGARKAGPLHSPKNCLPGAGWFEVSSGPLRIDLPGGGMDIVQAVYQNESSTELFLYWFQVGGEIISSEWKLKWREVVNSVEKGRRDASFIRVSVPIKDKDKARAQAEDFVKSVHPVLRGFLPS